MRKAMAACLAAALTMTLAAHALALSVGDKAPPLKVANWVKGDAIDLSKETGKIIVVEFWATWCGPCKASIPHLSDMQTRLSDAGVKIIGVTQEDPNNSLDTVKRFVEEQASGMAYTVAFDKGETYSAYMGGVGARGIPNAFVIDKEGKLAWYGHPMEPQFEILLDEMTKGTYDAVASRLKMKKVKRYQEMLDLNDHAGALKLIDELVTLDAANKDLYEVDRFHCMVMNRKTRKAALERGEEIVGKVNDPRMLATMARRMMTVEDGYSGKYDALALRAAEKAYAIDPREWTVLRSIAYAKFLNGDIKGAIALQEKAIAAANPGNKKELEDDLAHFRTEEKGS